MRPTILLVKNRENDAFFFRRALAHGRYDVEMRIVEPLPRAPISPTSASMPTAITFPSLRDRNRLQDERAVQCESLRVNSRPEKLQGNPDTVFSGTALPEGRFAALKMGALAFITKFSNFREVCWQVQKVLEYMHKRQPLRAAFSPEQRPERRKRFCRVLFSFPSNRSARPYF